MQDKGMSVYFCCASSLFLVCLVVNIIYNIHSSHCCVLKCFPQFT